MTGLVHISSLIVHARPERLECLRASIGGLPGCEIHAVDARGKLVVVLETESTHAVREALDRIQELAGVLAVNMVYHHAEAMETMAQELPDEADPT